MNNLDYNATVALHPEVLEAMLPYFDRSQHGNAMSRHRFGRQARAAIEHARSQVASAIGAQSSEIVFTASGTEANNFIMRGFPAGSGQTVVSRIEHPCILRAAEALAKQGKVVTYLEVDAQGQFDLQQLAILLQQPTALVSAMLANNETGVVNELPPLVELAHAQDALIHTDAVQAFGKIQLCFDTLGVDAMTVASHKMGGPQGAAALVLKKHVDIAPLLYGGGQEHGLRSGTENLAAIVGFGIAAERAVRALEANHRHISALRERLELGLHQLSLGVVIFGENAHRLPNTTFFAVPNVDGETLVIALDSAGFAVASGSACSSNNHQASHVLTAMGISEDLARGAVRVSLGEDNYAAQIDDFLMALKQTLTRFQRLCSLAV